MNTSTYHAVPFDSGDPRASEPLVKLEDYAIAGKSFYARTDGKNGPYFQKIAGSLKTCWSRKTIAEKLVCVNKRLAPYGVELFAWDGYRPIECQQGIWNFLIRQTRQKMPNASEHEVTQYALTYFSDPSAFDPHDSLTWPVHSSGGAVDVTLRSLSTGKLLDMGAGFDEIGEISFSRSLERKVTEGVLSEDDPQVQNRRLLHWAMHEEGFTNFGSEFWHFDYGDQMYVMHSKQTNAPTAAWYGYIASPEQV